MFENRINLRSGNTFKSVVKATAIGGVAAIGLLMLRKAIKNSKPAYETFNYFGKGKGRAYTIAESVERPANIVEKAEYVPRF